MGFDCASNHAVNKMSSVSSEIEHSGLDCEASVHHVQLNDKLLGEIVALVFTTYLDCADKVPTRPKRVQVC